MVCNFLNLLTALDEAIEELSTSIGPCDPGRDPGRESVSSLAQFTRFRATSCMYFLRTHKFSCGLHICSILCTLTYLIDEYIN